MKKLLKLTGIGIALVTVAAVMRATYKINKIETGVNQNSVEITKLKSKQLTES